MNDAPSSKSTLTLWDRIIILLALPAVTALLTIFGNQLFFKSNKETVEKLKLQIEIIKTTYPLYNKLKEFGELGLEVKKISAFESEITPSLNSTMDKYRIIINRPFDNKIMVQYTLPLIAIDTISYKRWLKLFDEVSQKSDIINSDTYIAAKQIVSFYNFKPDPFLYASIGNIWRDAGRLEEWISLNKKLILMTQKQLSFIEYN